MESIRQATQRKYTQLVNWLHGDSDRVQKMLNSVRESNPEQDSAWCIDKLWTDERSWRA
jgi:hypothetical protein